MAYTARWDVDRSSAIPHGANAGAQKTERRQLLKFVARAARELESQSASDVARSALARGQGALTVDL